MDEDEDAFLYGDEPQPSSNGHANAATKAGVQTVTVDGIAKAVVSGGEQGEQNEVDGAADEDGEGDDDGDDDEEEEEEEDEDDSDSDLEIIVDSNAVDARPPPGYIQRPIATFNKTLQTQRAAASAISPEYTPLTRPGQSSTAAASLAAAIGLSDEPAERKPLLGQTSLSAAQAQALQQQQQQQQMPQLPEGPPPPAPSTAPRLDLDPSEQSLMLPPDVVGGEPGPVVYHVDPAEMEEKPWRRPGADITDWFNYGFNEESWRTWGEKKTSVTTERLEMERDGVRPSEHRGRDTSFGGQQQQQQQQDTSSAASISMPPQQMQMMQAMMAASGLSMPPDQMMAFMGMSGGMGGFGAPQGGPMAGMMGMAPGGMSGMGGSGMFPFGGVPMMQQPMKGFMGQARPTNGGSLQGTQSPGPGAEAESESFNQQHRGYEHAESDEQARGQQGDTSVEQMNGSAGAHGEAASGPGQLLPNAPMPIGEVSSTSSGPSATGPAAPPTGPSRGAERGRSPLPQHVPTGPKNPGRRYNDRDTGAGAADTLDYGGGAAGARDDHEDRRLSAARSPAHDSSVGWDDVESSRSRRGHNSPIRGGDRDREHSRRHSRRTDDRDDDATPRSSRYDDDTGSDAERTRHASRSSRSTRDRDRSHRRRGDEVDEESVDGKGERRAGSNRQTRSGSVSNSTTDRSHARAERRAGRDVIHEVEESSHDSSARRSRKRTATDDVDALSPPPRESRRRR